MFYDVDVKIHVEIHVEKLKTPLKKKTFTPDLDFAFYLTGIGCETKKYGGKLEFTNFGGVFREFFGRITDFTNFSESQIGEKWSDRPLINFNM